MKCKTWRVNFLCKQGVLPRLPRKQLHHSAWSRPSRVRTDYPRSTSAHHQWTTTIPPSPSTRNRSKPILIKRLAARSVSMSLSRNRKQLNWVWLTRIMKSKLWLVARRRNPSCDQIHRLLLMVYQRSKVNQVQANIKKRSNSFLN